MSLPNPIDAVYEDGQLRLAHSLPLPNRQRVKVIVLPEETLEERVRQMHPRADEWLAQQEPLATREPQSLSPVERSALDAEFDQLLLEMQTAAPSPVSEDALAALVAEAVQTAREGNG